MVTLLNDVRVEGALKSLLSQERRPQEILVADGGSRDGSRRIVADLAQRNPLVVLAHLPGSVAATRNQALSRVRNDVIAFLDADETAPPGWLKHLVRPIEEAEADFTGGPTRPAAPPGSRTEAYVNRHDDWFYSSVVPNDLAMLPMGNSAWHRRVFDAIGGFDPDLRWAGEDYDVNLRALRAGFRGRFVPEAWVHHDQAGIATLGRLLRKRYRYMVGATVAYRKNGVALRRAGRSAARGAAFHHPYHLLMGFLKPLAFVRGSLEYRRIRRRVAEARS